MTCYLNSMLQTLYMTPEFRNALYRLVSLCVCDIGHYNVCVSCDVVGSSKEMSTKVPRVSPTNSNGCSSIFRWASYLMFSSYMSSVFVYVQTSSKRAVETTDVTKSFGWDSSEGQLSLSLSSFLSISLSIISHTNSLATAWCAGIMSGYVWCSGEEV